MKKYFVLVGIIVLGFVAATLAYRVLQTAAPTQDVAKIDCLSDAQKKLLESRDSMSKWLLGLAYSTLAGLLGLRFKDQNSLPVDTIPPMAGCGLLVVSLYGAFLFQDSMIFSLSKGPIYHIYGSLMDFPLQLQFWTLVSALIVLSFWLFRPPKKSVITVSLFLLLSFAMQSPAKASANSACFSKWEKDRGFKFSESGRTTAITVLEKLALRAGLKLPVPCDYTLSLLDELRWDAYVAKEVDSDAAMESYVRTIDEELIKPGFSTGEAISKLVNMSQVWRGVSGLLVVASQTKGIRVLLDGGETGMTTWERRLAPGLHSIDVVRAGRAVYSNKNVRIEDGKEFRINIDLP